MDKISSLVVKCIARLFEDLTIEYETNTTMND